MNAPRIANWVAAVWLVMLPLDLAYAWFGDSALERILFAVFAVFGAWVLITWHDQRKAPR